MENKFSYIVTDTHTLNAFAMALHVSLEVCHLRESRRGQATFKVRLSARFCERT